MSGISALIFDCFGVLYRDNIDMLYDVVSPEKQSDLNDLIHACDHGFISREDYYRGAAELSGKSIDDIKEIEKHQFVLNEQLLEKVKELKTKYKIGLLSNIGDQTMERLFPEPMRSELFDGFVISSKIGLIKPAAAIFEYAAEKLNLPIEQCVMIDDRMSNTEGAELAGMQSILFTTNRQFEIDLEELERQNA